MAEQLSLFWDNPSYDAFVDKFKSKKTTDDCYTPPAIYEVILDYVCTRWKIDPQTVVRPFYPGGDFEHYPYASNAVVVDNPPFSILSEIVRFYLRNGIQFFLFCPSLTALSGGIGCNHLICDCSITYDNGAQVRTSFVTSFGAPHVLESCPELTQRINDKMHELLQKDAPIPKYTYPDEVVTAAMAQRYAKYGIHFTVSRDECVFIRSLDAQKADGKAIYGGGLLLSEEKARERAAAEISARDLAAQTVGERDQVWKLSERERDIVRHLGV